MKLLAIDTATEACSVAVYAGSSVIANFEICPQQHSQRLLPMVDALLTEASLSLADLDGLIYGRGPGSFTGVRIATGMIQGLSLGTGLKVAGVSTLAAMAQQALDDTQTSCVACAIDARMGEVYFAVYQNVDGVATLVDQEIVCPPEQAAGLLPAAYVAVGTGWKAYEALSSQLDSAPQVLYPRAEFMLPLGRVLFETGRVSLPEEVEPVYLRDKVTWKKLPGRE
ncbi:tRNA (adenosine(37)-N6)-threonylcarbamoyltransferase complex dimerization subunit type 1 TsaB [Aestuariibacter sp. A3R04]|uniref:tRNA (adenosine(37)-N6)-threonylcarbamoyltransferase complex dimerization subunit type 1 TsaB n=1 Tax=Aestuariibacter sp. A3R04 TaxID=2841571 RepID=UPI001C0921A2|nr:tRNA (adenosine(37)-N6)-threonylcarbamoyltransferase complex dimerization subunit type 1 TsaB [Aestuariibacter sp. A3R04]MBU3023336.1 tRNA (adenosine(37)-N6)-threonylcarbamoyltransferase complex dimerization subunit type 1 TsaB [Aestuariibacter sp. A3R04]